MPAVLLLQSAMALKEQLALQEIVPENMSHCAAKSQEINAAFNVFVSLCFTQSCTEIKKNVFAFFDILLSMHPSVNLFSKDGKINMEVFFGVSHELHFITVSVCHA